MFTFAMKSFLCAVTDLKLPAPDFSPVTIFHPSTIQLPAVSGIERGFGTRPPRTYDASQLRPATSNLERGPLRAVNHVTRFFAEFGDTNRGVEAGSGTSRGYRPSTVVLTSSAQAQSMRAYTAGQLSTSIIPTGRTSETDGFSAHAPVPSPLHQEAAALDDNNARPQSSSSAFDLNPGAAQSREAWATEPSQTSTAVPKLALNVDTTAVHHNAQGGKNSNQPFSPSASMIVASPTGQVLMTGPAGKATDRGYTVMINSNNHQSGVTNSGGTSDKINNGSVTIRGVHNNGFVSPFHARGHGQPSHPVHHSTSSSSQQHHHHQLTATHGDASVASSPLPEHDASGPQEGLDQTSLASIASSIASMRSPRDKNYGAQLAPSSLVPAVPAGNPTNSPRPGKRTLQHGAQSNGRLGAYGQGSLDKSTLAVVSDGPDTGSGARSRANRLQSGVMKGAETGRVEDKGYGSAVDPSDISNLAVMTLGTGIGSRATGVIGATFYSSDDDAVLRESHDGPAFPGVPIVNRGADGVDHVLTAVNQGAGVEQPGGSRTDAPVATAAVRIPDRKTAYGSQPTRFITHVNGSTSKTVIMPGHGHPAPAIASAMLTGRLQNATARAGDTLSARSAAGGNAGMETTRSDGSVLESGRFTARIPSDVAVARRDPHARAGLGSGAMPKPLSTDEAMLLARGLPGGGNAVIYPLIGSAYGKVDAETYVRTDPETLAPVPVRILANNGYSNETLAASTGRSGDNAATTYRSDSIATITHNNGGNTVRDGPILEDSTTTAATRYYDVLAPNRIAPSHRCASTHRALRRHAGVNIVQPSDAITQHLPDVEKQIGVVSAQPSLYYADRESSERHLDHSSSVYNEGGDGGATSSSSAVGHAVHGNARPQVSPLRIPFNEQPRHISSDNNDQTHMIVGFKPFSSTTSIASISHGEPQPPRADAGAGFETSRSALVRTLYKDLNSGAANSIAAKVHLNAYGYATGRGSGAHSDRALTASPSSPMRAVASSSSPASSPHAASPSPMSGRSGSPSPTARTTWRNWDNIESHHVDTANSGVPTSVRTADQERAAIASGNITGTIDLTTFTPDATQPLRTTTVNPILHRSGRPSPVPEVAAQSRDVFRTTYTDIHDPRLTEHTAVAKAQRHADALAAEEKRRQHEEIGGVLMPDGAVFRIPSLTARAGGGTSRSPSPSPSPSSGLDASSSFSASSTGRSASPVNGLRQRPRKGMRTTDIHDPIIYLKSSMGSDAMREALLGVDAAYDPDKRRAHAEAPWPLPNAVGLPSHFSDEAHEQYRTSIKHVFPVDFEQPQPMRTTRERQAAPSTLKSGLEGVSTGLGMTIAQSQGLDGSSIVMAQAQDGGGSGSMTGRLSHTHSYGVSSAMKYEGTARSSSRGRHDASSSGYEVHPAGIPSYRDPRPGYGHAHGSYHASGFGPHAEPSISLDAGNLSTFSSSIVIAHGDASGRPALQSSSRNAAASTIRSTAGGEPDGMRRTLSSSPLSSTSTTTPRPSPRVQSYGSVVHALRNELSLVLQAGTSRRA